MTGAGPEPAARSAGARIGVAAAIWSGAILLARFIGFIRETVIARTLGVSAEADVYFAAFTVPDFVNYLLAGGLLSLTFIPIFSRHLARGDEAAGWDSFSDIANFLLLIALPVTLAVALAAPWIVPWVAPGFDEDQLRDLARLTRIILPGQVFIMLGALLSGTLLARDRHAVPALAPSAYTLFIIALGLLLWRRLGAEGFAWGVLAGAALGSFGVPLVACMRTGMRWRPRMRLGNPDFRLYLALSLPVMLGQSIVVVDQWLWKWQGSHLETGAVSWLQYARTLLNVPSGVFGMAAGAAAYPTLVRLHHEGRFEESYRLLTQAARMTLLLALLSQAVLTVLGQDAIALVWGYANPRFTPEDVLRSAQCLALFALALGAWSLHPLFARGFYAMGNTWAPTVIGTVVTLAVVPLYIGLRAAFGALGLALASSLSLLAYIVPLHLWQRRAVARTAGVAAEALPRWGPFLLRSVAATAAATGAMALLHRGLSMLPLGDGPVPALVRVAVVGTSALPLFLAACRLTRVEEAGDLSARVSSRLGRLVARLRGARRAG